jgi:hypothetical protein
MPELSRFYGIVIRMYSEPTTRHGVPHFHAYHAENQAVFSIASAGLMIGYLPPRQRRLVEAWAEIHHDELQTAWRHLEHGGLPDPIEPLT